MATKRKHDPNQARLPMDADNPSWKPPSMLPVLDSRYKRVWMDTETTGTDIHGTSQVAGISCALEDGSSFYLPVRHRGGGNLDLDLVTRWGQRELRDKVCTFTEAKFDIQGLRKMGVDLEAQGCQVREVQFMAGLLEDDRRSFKLDDMAFDFLGERKLEIDHEKIGDYPASLVGPYAERDAELVRELDRHLQVKIDAEELQDVLDLENSIIYAVCEMERNGALIDMPKLSSWQTQLAKEYRDLVFYIAEQTGLKINPDSAKDMERLFKALGLTYGTTETGLGSFTDAFLQTFPNPIVQAARRARIISSLRSKYIDKYSKAIVGNILRYKLHQLKGDDYGTISGRFSSSSVNIQQVYAPRRQKKKLGTSDFAVRELFIPEPGHFWMKADAAQIEFRLFCHYSRSARLLQAYRDNPDTDFHEAVRILLATRKDIDRDSAKAINFGMLYGMGKGKMADQMGLPMDEAVELFDAYNEMFPEASTLMRQAMDTAKKRGFVKTLMGRRARFPEGKFLHSAINRVIQGTAAEVMKRKIRDVYNERKRLGITKLRFTVHDELDTDIDSPDRVKGIKEVLDADVFGLRVPLTWDVKVGKNWAMQ